MHVCRLLLSAVRSISGLLFDAVWNGIPTRQATRRQRSTSQTRYLDLHLWRIVRLRSRRTQHFTSVFLRASRTCTPAPRDGSCPLRTKRGEGCQWGEMEAICEEPWLSVERVSSGSLRCGAPIALSFSRNSPVSSGPQSTSSARGAGWKARAAGVAYPRRCTQRPSTRRAPRTAASARP